MKNPRKAVKGRRPLTLFFSVILMSMTLSMTSFAGGINGNEQSVVSVIHGQFEKNGVIYSVKQEYINSAMEYLSRDDVDLTAEQAQQVIGEIYANVQTGVESGYLTEIGRTQTSPPAPESAPAGEGAGNEAGETKAGQPSNGGETANGSKAVQPDEPAQSQDGESQPEEEGEGEAALPGESLEEQESGAPAEPETEPEPKVPAVISILELVDKAPPQSYDYISRDTDHLMSKMNLPYELGIWVLGAFAVILILTASIAWGKGLLAQHRNHKLRKVLKAILTVETGAFTAIFLGGCALGIGAWQDGAVLNKLADTGYYQTIYEDLRKDTSISFALLDIPDHVMDNSITYERVVLAARQQVESDLSQGAYRADTGVLTRMLEDDIKAYLSQNSVIMTEQAEAGLDLLMDRLEDKYANLLKWPFSPWWVMFAGEFWKTMKWILPGAFVLLVLTQVLLVYLHHYKHRGIALCGKGILAGSILACAGSVAGMVLSKGLTIDVKPDFMKVFFEHYIAGIWRTGILLGGIGMLAGAMYLLVVRAWKEGKK